MKKVLFDAESVRPYMFTRMPQYGEPNLRHLPDLFSRLDKVPNVKFLMPNSESPNKKERARDAGNAQGRTQTAREQKSKLCRVP